MRNRQKTDPFFFLFQFSVKLLFIVVFGRSNLLFFQMSVAELFHTPWTVKEPRLKQTCYRSAWLPLTVWTICQSKDRGFTCKKTKKDMNLNVMIRYKSCHLWENFGMLSPWISMLVWWQMVVNVWSNVYLSTDLFNAGVQNVLDCFIQRIPAWMRLCGKQTLGSDLLKQSGMPWVFLFFLISVPEVLVIE